MKQIFTSLLIIFTIMNTGCEKNVHHTDIVKGGWVNIDKNSKDVIDAYTFLKEKLSKSNPEITNLAVIKSQSQVVEGNNLGLICEYTAKTGGKKKMLFANIHIDLNHQHSILELNPNYREPTKNSHE